MVQELKDYLQIILQMINLLIIAYGGYKFLNKPHDSLEEQHKELEKRVDKIDLKIDDIEDSLRKGNDKFRNQEETNSAFKKIMILFTNFEIAYCLHTDYEHTEDLLEAKRELDEFLSGKKHHET